MKKLISLLSLLVIATVAMAQTAPAFPGAEGFARYTTKGGRGYSVYHVTNLKDSGTGSFRDAVSSGNRIIVFDVSGYIDLASDIKISKSNITIAGQTAPGDGITLRYRTITVSGDNIIIRFLRFRRSQVKDVNDGADAIWGRNKNNIILDHCSFSWSIDEIASFYDNKNFTMQWCTLGEALANPGHSKGAHSYGGIWGGKGASFHHNFLCHMQNRVPRFNGARYMWTGGNDTQYKNPMQAERVDFRNCVMYNWGTGGCYGGPGGGYVNMVNNYYKAGPGTSNKRQVTQVTVGAEGNSSGYPDYWGYASRYFINGNYVTDAGEEAANYDWKGVIYDEGLYYKDGDRYIPDAAHNFGDVEYTKVNNVDCVRLRLDAPIAAGDVTTHDAETAYEKVLAYAGASYVRDDVDARYMEEARTGTTTYRGEIVNRAGIIDLVNDPAKTPSAIENYENHANYPELKSETRPANWDTDKDGMPDWWEDLNGLNKNSNADAKTYTLDSKKWYTNVEVYLNGIVEDIIKGQNEGALDGSAVEEYYPAANHNNPASITTVEQGSAPVRVEYYSLDGKRLAQPADGISIRKTIYTDGSAFVDKVIKK